MAASVFLMRKRPIEANSGHTKVSLARVANTTIVDSCISTLGYLQRSPSVSFGE